MSDTPIIKYLILHVGQDTKSEPEKILADSCTVEGDPPTYVFQKAGEEVKRIFVHALQCEPSPIHGKTDAEYAANRAAMQRLQPNNLGHEPGLL